MGVLPSNNGLRGQSLPLRFATFRKRSYIRGNGLATIIPIIINHVLLIFIIPTVTVIDFIANIVLIVMSTAITAIVRIIVNTSFILTTLIILAMLALRVSLLLWSPSSLLTLKFFLVFSELFN